MGAWLPCWPRRAGTLSINPAGHTSACWLPCDSPCLLNKRGAHFAAMQDALSCLLSEDPATAQQAMHSLMAEQQPQQRQQQPWAAPAKGGGLVMPPAVGV